MTFATLTAAPAADRPTTLEGLEQVQESCAPLLGDFGELHPHHGKKKRAFRVRAKPGSFVLHIFHINLLPISPKSPFPKD